METQVAFLTTSSETLGVSKLIASDLITHSNKIIFTGTSFGENGYIRVDARQNSDVTSTIP